MESILSAQFWRWLRLCLTILSYLVAVIAWFPPRRYMPVDFHFVLFGSLPLAGIWITLVAVCLACFRRRGFAVVLGAPLALYWPIWLLFNRIPECYWRGNCI